MAADKGTIFHLETDGYGLVDDLAQEIPFKKVTWGTGKFLPRKVYRVDSLAEILSFPSLAKVVSLIEDNMPEKRVNGLWLNLYESGTDYCPYHRDSYNCDVVSFSSGITRDFVVKDDTTKATTKYPLSDGDLLYFDQTVNAHNTHSVPKRKNVDDRRVSVIVFLE